MLLQKLTEFARDRLELPPEMYLKRPIRWLIRLDSSGGLEGIIRLSDGTKKDNGQQLLAPHVKRSGGNFSAKLLCDNSEYVFSIPKKLNNDVSKRNEELIKVQKRFANFLDLLNQCFNETNNADVKAVYEFLKCKELDKSSFPESYKPDDEITFEVDGRMPMDDAVIRGWWASCTADQDGRQGVCILCGNSGSLISREPIPFKGIPGGKASLAMNTANSKSFESYGLKNSEAAPVCRVCAEGYAKAANSLSKDMNGKSHITIGPLIYLFWTKKSGDVGFMSMLDQPDSETIHQLLIAPQLGHQTGHFDSNEFYATSWSAWSAIGARVSVRDWLETTVGEARVQVANWFRWQRLVNLWTNEIGEPLPIEGYWKKEGEKSVWHEGLLDGLLPSKTSKNAKKVQNESWLAMVVSILFRSALHGDPLPDWMLFQAVRRNRAEQGVTYPRAALIKAVMASQQKLPKEVSMEKSEPGKSYPVAYRYGELLALLEAIQKMAIGGKASLTDRFYGSASSAPASVFWNLMRGNRAHMSKLRKNKPGMFHIFEKDLESVIHEIPEFKKTLTLEEQGLFSLGYYHRKADMRSRAIKAKLERENKLNNNNQGE